MEEENKKSKNGIIVFLIFIIIGLGLFICYDKLIANERNNNSKNVDNKPSVTPVPVDSEIVKNAMESFSKISLYDDIYDDDVYDISNVSNEVVLLTALNNVDDKYIDYCTDTSKKEAVSIDTLNSIVGKYILNKTITMDYIKEISNYDGYGWFYISGTGVKITGACGDIFEGEDYVEKNIFNAEISGDYLYVYEKEAFARFIINGDDITNVDYYKDFNRTEVVEKNMKSWYIIAPEDPKPENSTPNWDLYNTYKYTFKKVNDTYYFQRFELVK